MCQICKVIYGSEAVSALIGKCNWVKCGNATCKYWIHASCAGIKYPENKAGEKSRKIGKGSFSFVQNIFSNFTDSLEDTQHGSQEQEAHMVP